MVHIKSFLFLLALCFTVALTSDCHCKDIEPVYTEDCCIGTGGQYVKVNTTTGEDSHCHFSHYGHFASFNRCCDSYWGIARCILSGRPVAPPV
ncbi:hypothetical protein BCR43DRAFT_484799 [Syncephalastrum racemosum]|uniref:Uncharacterized protein n=1 Tax=Syncephalastrum racemosum TaxID=13706 RepID=A0A1X2HLE9_SYNRA|nr:hypothetical protein BCR43DRAFT_484799 [Syncephalastrum racemosum]